jgi:predicted nucleic acid-binding OB-fold protein
MGQMSDFKIQRDMELNDRLNDMSKEELKEALKKMIANFSDNTFMSYLDDTSIDMELHIFDRATEGLIF